ncbi:glycoside hydrolase family 28 protein [Halpernia frigidisoli]|uniref:Polygalacturonase n=1 Tax=Halpernia frigidisoli TaxID=1125876 RepID=A0A1I3GE68_9FLAO|nr:glycosyl hydrolase family 28 protein [Halpernia frigidisoli]SFI21798.1 Polygalacturonase [Halpernia frigidisoli]
MKKLAVSFFIFLTALCTAQKNSIDYYIKNAPFDFGKMVLPEISATSYNIKDFGGVGDGKTLNTEAFKKAICAISEKGGGILNVPSGIWLTGPIEVKSKINFHVEKGAIIQFSNDYKQYPIREYSKGKFDVTPPLWGNNLKDVAFTGEGIFDGAGEAWRPIKKFKLSSQEWDKLVKSGGVLSEDGKIWWPSIDAMSGENNSKIISKLPNATAADYEKLHLYLRPMMFTLAKVTNLLIDGPTFRNSPKFVINPKNITNLVIRNVTVYNPKWAQNGDGIDISASKNVIIYNTKVNAGDDGICMKSSSSSKDDSEANLQNVIIAECTVNEAHGGFVIGSNTDGGMKNIFVSNCLFDGTDIGIRVKSNSGRGGDVSQIFIQNIEMKNIINEAILFDTFYADAPAGSSKESQDSQMTGDKVPYFHDFHISNVNCESAETAFSFTGLPNKLIENLYFKNINITSKKGITGKNAANLYFENVKINNSTDYNIDSALKNAVVKK